MLLHLKVLQLNCNPSHFLTVKHTAYYTLASDRCLVLADSQSPGIGIWIGTEKSDRCIPKFDPRSTSLPIFGLVRSQARVRHCQDGDGREQPTEIHDSSSETCGLCHQDYVHIVYSLWVCPMFPHCWKPKQCSKMFKFIE